MFVVCGLTTRIFIVRVVFNIDFVAFFNFTCFIVLFDVFILVILYVCFKLMFFMNVCFGCVEDFVIFVVLAMKYDVGGVFMRYLKFLSS